MIVVPDATGTAAIDHDVVPEAVPLPPRLVDQLTWVTPTASLAVPLTAIVPLVAVYDDALVGEVIDTVGAVASRLTVSVSVDVLLAASRAVMVMIVVPDGMDTDAIVHDVVPVATPLPPRLVVQLTCVTPTLSLAVPATASVEVVAVYDVPLVGDVIVTVGAVVSAGAGTVNARPVLHALLPAEFEARTQNPAEPGARVTAGLAEHVPLPGAHPATVAVYVASIFPDWLASLTNNWY
jgi:hypothetical protein